MREPIGGTDDERVERVAAVEAGSAGGGGRFAAVRALGEVRRPALLSIAESSPFSSVSSSRSSSAWERSFGLRERSVLGEGGVVPGGRRCDADPELYLLSEPPAQRIGNRRAQMTFDLVLDKAARHRQQSKALDDGERLDEVKPRSLLRG